MFLAFDTETSGLRRDDLPVDDPSQPHLLQLGAQLFDAKWERRGMLTMIVRPDGWTIEPEAIATHGINEIRANRFGVDVRVALAAFKALSDKAEIIIGHNVEFDRNIISAELSRCGADGLWWKRRGPAFRCTMEAATPIVQLRGEFGFKFPTLEEAHRFFLPAIDFQTKHDAEADLEATVRVYRSLVDRGAWPAINHPSILNR